MFCAAIPMSATIGAALAGKQKERQRQAQHSSQSLPQNRIAIAKTTLMVMAGLLVCSMIYHLVILPRSGAVVG